MTVIVNKKGKAVWPPKDTREADAACGRALGRLELAQEAVDRAVEEWATAIVKGRQLRRDVDKASRELERLRARDRKSDRRRFG